MYSFYSQRTYYYYYGSIELAPNFLLLLNMHANIFIEMENLVSEVDFNMLYEIGIYTHLVNLHKQNRNEQENLMSGLTMGTMSSTLF